MQSRERQSGRVDRKARLSHLPAERCAPFSVVVELVKDRAQYDLDGVADRALQFRPRQNVVLELGFFYGRLGWENVFVVLKRPDKLFPNFERPSDLDGGAERRTGSFREQNNRYVDFTKIRKYFGKSGFVMTVHDEHGSRSLRAS